MAKSTAISTRLIGLVLAVIGCGLAIWAYQLSGSVSSQFTQVFTGSEPDKVMALYIGGATSIVISIYLVFKK